MSVSSDQRYQSAEEFMQALLNANTVARKRASQGATVLSPARAASDATVVSPGGVPPAGATVRSNRPITTPLPPAPAAAGRPGWIKWLVIALVAAVVIVGVGGVLLVMSGLPQKMLSPSKPSATPLLPTDTVIAALPPTDTQPSAATGTPQPVQTSQPSATVTSPAAALPPTSTDTVAAAASPTSATTPNGGGAGQIAFVSNRNEGYQIWLMNSDGSNQVQITHIKEGACQPSWSPDGQHLVIVSPCDGKKDQYPGSSLFIINADGSGKTALSDNTFGEFDPAWSPDGTRIVCTSLRDEATDRRLRQLYIYNLADKSTTKLSQNIYESDWEPAWLPDGTQVAYVSDVGNMTRIFVINVDGKTPPQRFTRDEFGLAYMPAWSPDGKQMIYAGNSTALPDLIGQKIVDQKTQIASQFVIYKELTPVWNAKYSADGQWILYQGVDQSANSDIYPESPMARM